MLYLFKLMFNFATIRHVLGKCREEMVNNEGEIAEMKEYMSNGMGGLAKES